MNTATRQPYSLLNPAELAAQAEALEAQMDQLRGNNLQLDLTRGKPAAEQLSLADALDGVLNGDYFSKDGTDTRNYGGLRGVIEARELGAEMLGVAPQQVLAGGNSSLQLMHTVTACLQSHRWANGTPTMLCPVPGYDRHFTLCESFGLPMRAVALTDSGPDMDELEAMVAADAEIGGIWCVPRFSNPDGCTYSDATVERMAQLPERAAHPDFIVFWDNAYAVHALQPNAPVLASLLAAAENAGTADHVVEFASTSKVTFAGAGVAFCAASEATLATLEAYLVPATIGPDKVNQLRTARFLAGRLDEHMEAHARLLRPKFAAVQSILEEHLDGLDIANWTTPQGGYFVSLDTRPGLAREVVALAATAGVTLTAAGATFPGGHDPKDSNIRIAPTFADLPEVQTAIEVLAIAIKLASVRQLQKETQV